MGFASSGESSYSPTETQSSYHEVEPTSHSMSLGWPVTWLDQGNEVEEALSDP